VYNNIDNNPDDGWELLKKDMGGINSDNGQSVVNPYMVMYNKRNGKIRVFMAPGLQNTGQLLKIVIGPNTNTQNRSSIFDLASGRNLATFEPYQGGTFESVVPLFATPGKWTYADFQTSYDPCTCKYGNNGLRIFFQLINQSSVNLFGQINGTLSPITGASAPSSSRVSFSSIGNDYVKGYGIVNDFKEDLKKYVGETSNSYKDFKKFLEDGTNILSQGFQAVPYVKEALALFNFFAGGGGGPQAVQVQPMALKANLSLQGSISSSQYYDEVVFNTPGSNSTNTSDANYPHYNEVLGVFNLVKKPVVQYEDLGPVDDAWNACPNSNPYYQCWVNFHQFRLKLQPLKFALNPAAGVNIQEVEISLITEDLSYPYSVSPTTAFTFSVPSANGIGLATVPIDANCLNKSFVERFIPTHIRVSLNLSTPGSNVMMTQKYALSTIEMATPESSCEPQFNMFKEMGSSELSAYCSYSSVYKNGRINALKKPSTETNLPTSSNEQEAIKVSVSPNPASDNLTVGYTLKTGQNVKSYITDLTGKIISSVFSKDVEKGEYSLDFPLQDIPNGMYLLVFDSGGERTFRKFVVAK
jgi:hypothetical protein